MWKAGLSRVVSAATVRKYWAVLSAVMRDAVPRYRPDNPLTQPVGRRGNGLPRLAPYPACFLTRQEAAVLIAHCPAEIQDLVQVALGTGLRLGELLGLRVAAVKVGEPTPLVRVEQTLHRTGQFGVPKTAAARRSVALAPSTASLLAALVAGRRADELVFLSPDGLPWDAGNLRRRFWQPAVAAAGRCEQHPDRSDAFGPRCRCANVLRKRGCW